jgi:hypothetical protein
MKKIAIGVLIIALAALCGFQTYNVDRLNTLQARLTFEVVGLQNVMAEYCKQFSEAADTYACKQVLERSRLRLGKLQGEWFQKLQMQWALEGTPAETLGDR